MLQFTIDRQYADVGKRGAGWSNLRWRDLHMRHWLAYVSTVAACALWFAFLDWHMALAIIGVIAIHESGHTLTAQYFNLKGVKGWCLIPLLGGVAVSNGKRSWRQHFWIIFMGPVVGSLPLFLLLPAAALTDDPWLWKITALFAYVNVFNLMPLYPLDGGQLLATTLISHFWRKTVQAVALAVNFVIGALAFFVFDMPVLTFFAAIGSILATQIGTSRDPMSPVRIEGSERWRWIALWIGFAALLIAVAWVAGFDKNKILMV